jgi:exodeoxyribonuclease V alpha subunit
MQFDTSQQLAISRATSLPFSIITGGAGSGKTTIIREITERLEHAGETVSLCAFAGKAAARIREACDHPASTIHRLLGYTGTKYMTESLSDQSVIVDECSMVDASLLAEIVRRNPKRLVLVGDQAQLPPVGRGQPFHDLIVLLPNLVSNLTTCYRATEAVFNAASIIRSGGRPPEFDTSEGERWTMMNTGDAARTQAKILEWVKADAFDWERDIIIVARNGETDVEPCTVKGLNKAIVNMISPRGENEKFKVGDRVINTKNLPDLDFFNGSTGTIHSIDIDGGIYIRTDIPAIDRRKTTDERNPVYTMYVLFSRELRKHLQLAYALTVHKSQGSSYRNVCLACFNRDIHAKLLDRSIESIHRIAIDLRPGILDAGLVAALEWLALRADVREAFRARGITDPREVPLITTEIISAALKAELEALAARPENMIDTSDIPEVMDWRAAERGRFYRPTRLYPAQLGLSRS